MADKHIKGPGNTTILYEDQGDGTWAEVVSILGGVSSGSGGTGVVRVYRPTSYTQVLHSASGVSCRIAIPAGSWSKDAVGLCLFTLAKTTAGTDTPSASVYVGATGFTPSGSTNRMATAFAVPSTANGVNQTGVWLWGNRTDLTTLKCAHQLNTASPFSSSITTAANVTSGTLNLANAWDIALNIAVSSTDDAIIQDAIFIVYDVNGSQGSSLLVKDEGSTLTSAATSINFVGASVTATHSGANVTVTVPAATTLTVKDEGSTLTAAATSIDFVGAGVVATESSGAVTVTISTGGTTSWYTVTPNVSNAVPITIDYNNSKNILLKAPVDGVQVVSVPSNLPDGEEMEIDMVGGGGSGSWATWGSTSPATPGYVFLVSGVAPTADASTSMCTPCFVKRRDVKYEVTVAPVKVV